MYMDTKSTGIGIILLTLLTIVLGVAAYPSLPSDMVCGWDSFGQASSYLPKFWGVFLFPLILAFVYLLWFSIPRLEPMKKNLEVFRHSYNGFWLVVAVFFFYIFTLVLGANAGWEFDFRQAIAPALALLLASIAALLEHSRRNFFVGIRTPWTLSSDKVWKRTHILGAKLFYLCAVSTFAGAVYPEFLLWYLLVPLAVTVLITVSYSYIEFRRHQV